MTLADFHYQTSACLELVRTDRVDLALKFYQIRWQGMLRLQTQGCFVPVAKAAVGYMTMKKATSGYI